MKSVRMLAIVMAVLFTRVVVAQDVVKLPVFHGQKDTRVPHKRSEDMVEALKSKGAEKVKFTSYPDQGHNRVLGLAINHPELYKWFMSHSRSKPARPDE